MPARRTLARSLRKDWVLYFMLLPGVIAILLFNYGPMFGLSIAFLNYNPILGIAKSKFVGFKYFADAIGDSAFRQALVNTVVIKVGQTLVTFPCSIILALLLNEARPWYKKTVQTSTILPFFLSWIAIAAMFSDLLSPTSGVVNEVLMKGFGMQKPIAFLSSNDWFRWVIIFQDTWKMAGYFALIYLSAIAGIDPAIYEAATLDGCGRWRKIWYVTLAGIRTTIATMLVLLMGYLIIGPFEQVFAQYNSAVYNTGDVIETFAFRLGLTSQKYGFATAIGLMQGIVACVIVLVTNFFVKRSESSVSVF